MKLRALTLFFILATPLHSSLAADFPSQVQATLPASVQKLKLHSTTPEQAEKILGKADLIENSDYYWELGGIKYSLSLNFKNKKLNTYQYHYSENKPQRESFNIPEKDLSITHQPARPEEKAARIFRRGQITLVFDSRSDDLESVEFK